MFSTNEAIKVVGEAKNGAEAVALTRETLPYVVIFDVEMSIIGAAEATGRLVQVPSTPRVVVTMHDNTKVVRELLARGAIAYLVNSASIEELVTAVHTKAESPRVSGEEDTGMVVLREAFERAETGRIRLSNRELEVLLLVAQSLSNRPIAGALHLPETTVKRHPSSIYPKSRAYSRSEATKKLLSEGWISTYGMTRARG